MAEEAPVDLWGVLDEAEQTVEQWDAWRRAIEADVWGGTTDAAAPGEPPVAAR